MKTYQVLLVLMVLTVMALPAVAQEAEKGEAAPVTAPTVYYDKLVLKVDGKADVNGVVKLEFQAHNADPKLVSVNVVAKMKAKDLASDLWKELTLAGGNQFKVKQNDKKIKIQKANKKGPAFTLAIVEQNVKGISISIE